MPRRWLSIATLLAYLVLAAVVVSCFGELRWALAALPDYLAHTIPPPAERSLLLEAPEAESERATLERALAIDPYSPARLALADLLFDREEHERALEQYAQYLAFDPSVAQVYVKMSAIHELAGRQAEALRVLEQGARYFAEHAEDYRPILDDEVAPQSNRKAEWLYDYYQSSARFLDWERARLATAAPSTRPPEP